MPCTPPWPATAGATSPTSASWARWPRPCATASCTTACIRLTGGGGTATRWEPNRASAWWCSCRTTIRSPTAFSATGWGHGRGRTSSGWRRSCCCPPPTCRCCSWVRSTARPRRSCTSPATAIPTLCQLVREGRRRGVPVVLRGAAARRGLPRSPEPGELRAVEARLEPGGPATGRHAGVLPAADRPAEAGAGAGLRPARPDRRQPPTRTSAP